MLEHSIFPLLFLSLSSSPFSSLPLPLSPFFSISGISRGLRRNFWEVGRSGSGDGGDDSEVEATVTPPSMEQAVEEVGGRWEWKRRRLGGGGGDTTADGASG